MAPTRLFFGRCEVEGISAELVSVHAPFLLHRWFRSIEKTILADTVLRRWIHLV